MRIYLGTPLVVNAIEMVDIVTNAAIMLLFRLLIESSRSRNIGDVY